MDAIADTFTARELRNYEAKKHGFISFEAAESFEAKKRGSLLNMEGVQNEGRTSKKISGNFRRN